jgi:hypothetical protein
VTQDDLALRIPGLRLGETPFLQPLGTDPESASVPDEDLQPIALAVAEQEQVPAQRLTRQTIADETVQPFEPLAHVGDPGRPDRSVWLGPVQTQLTPAPGWPPSVRTYSYQNQDAPRSGVRPAAPRPAQNSVPAASAIFLAANSTGTKRPAEEIGLRLLFQRCFFRWRSRVLKLNPRLWQNSLRRIPLLTNSATNC